MDTHRLITAASFLVARLTVLAAAIATDGTPRAGTAGPGSGDHPVDRILATYASTTGAEPASVVDDHAFLRRAYLDLVGLLPSTSFAAYDTGRFGRGCLIARRLVEAGARFIEVTTEYEPFEHWDTHENGHETTRRMKQLIDRPVARLVLDLEERGLLDRTLVVLASEFSRDMLVEGRPGSSAKDQSRAPADTMQELRQYGMHRHFTLNGSALLFGGGMRRGYVHGETADERPCVVTRDPVTVTDLHATIYAALGISPRTSLKVERRPFYVTEDGDGRPVEALFA